MQNEEKRREEEQAATGAEEVRIEDVKDDEVEKMQTVEQGDVPERQDDETQPEAMDVE